MSEQNWGDRCWVTTVYLVREGKVLLSYNTRVDLWVPIGGHIDPGEDPVEAVRREVREELGADVRFEFRDKETRLGERVRCIHQPNHIQVEEVPHHKYHMNFVYFARCADEVALAQNDEGDKLRWFTRAELGELHPSVAHHARLALDAMGFK